MLIGQDTRDGDGNGDVSGDGATEGGLHNADTTMVVQIGADRNYVNLVSIPRDSLVDVPACHTSKETIPAQYGVQFNSIFANAYSVGGDLSSAASCTVNAVNALTGLHISNFIVVDFNGLSKMIDSIDGVDLCFPSDVDDPNTNMHLKKGMHHLNGVEATNYARRRHGNDTDGSDIMRTTRQQYLIKSVLQKAISRNLFTQTSQLYQLVMNAIRSLNFSSGMADTNALMGLALSLRNLKVDHLYSQTVPIMSAPQDPNRVVWTEDAKAGVGQGSRKPSRYSVQMTPRAQTSRRRSNPKFPFPRSRRSPRRPKTPHHSRPMTRVRRVRRRSPGLMRKPGCWCIPMAS